MATLKNESYYEVWYWDVDNVRIDIPFGLHEYQDALIARESLKHTTPYVIHLSLVSRTEIPQ